MFHVLAYQVNAGVNDANVNMSAAVDATFPVSANNNYIFTVPLDVHFAAAFGASILRARFNVPHLNSIFQPHLTGINRSVTVPSPFRMDDFSDYPMRLPTNEEIQIQESGNLGAGNEREQVFLIVRPPGANRNVPRGIQRQVVRATAAVVRAANAWGTDGALTFETALRGGWYAIAGVLLQESGSMAFRLNLPRAPYYGGHKLFPGFFGLTNINDVGPQKDLWNQLGLWGYFHSFEPPTVNVFSTAAGAGTEELRLDLVYLGNNQPSYPDMPAGIYP